ncbi:MAG: cytochrome c oxidase subunit II [Alphaproteobacteria bacterium]
MFRKSVFAALAALAVCAGFAAGAFATGQPEPWQVGFQDPASPVMARIVGFHEMLLWIITAIALFVLGLMIYVMVRFRSSRNPTPTRTAHNTLLEVVWTVIPVMILVVIAVPSFKLLYFEDRVVDADMTLKVIGHQWYWSYEYPDHGNFTFDSFVACRTQEECDEMAEGGEAEAPLRLLDTDNRVVLPVDTNVRLLLTAGDVIHSWAIPSLGIKWDTVPGRLNETWVRIEEEGTYYGQCSELCGMDHGFMPIAVEAVSKEAFDQWVVEAQTQFARDEGRTPSLRVARSEQR